MSGDTEVLNKEITVADVDIYTIDKNNEENIFHIELNREEAQILKSFLCALKMRP